MEKPTFYRWMDHTRAAQNQLAEIAKLTGLGQGRMLDIGCGDGSYLAFFQSHGWECLGIAKDQETSDYAYQQYEVLTLIGHPSELGIPRESYDLVRIRGELSTDENPEQLLKIAYEVTVPTGYLIVEVWHGRGWPLCPLSETIKFHYSKSSLKSILKNAGFEVGGIIAPEMGEPVWSPIDTNHNNRPSLWKINIDKIQGFIDRGSLLVAFGQKPPR